MVSVGGVIFTRGNSERRAPVPLCPPQMANELAWERTIASPVRGLLLNAGKIRIVGYVGVISDDPICCP